MSAKTRTSSNSISRKVKINLWSPKSKWRMSKLKQWTRRSRRSRRGLSCLPLKLRLLDRSLTSTRWALEDRRTLVAILLRPHNLERAGTIEISVMKKEWKTLETSPKNWKLRGKVRLVGLISWRLDKQRRTPMRLPTWNRSWLFIRRRMRLTCQNLKVQKMK